jgi:hypothetical protein
MKSVILLSVSAWGAVYFSCGPLDLTVSGDMLRSRLSFPRGGEIKVHHDLRLAMLRAHGEALALLLCDNGRLLAVDEVVALL